MSINWPAFVEIINSNQRFILLSHIRPDCDALGSELAMAMILERLGKHVRIVNGMATPPNLAFIDPRQKIETLGEDVQADELDDVDVLMVLDTSAWAQIGPMREVVEATKARKIVLDHHVGEDDLGAELFKERTADSTGSLVTEAAAHLGVELTPDIALPLYAAIATDTGWFRFNSVDGDTYRRAARLLDAGAVPSEIYQELYEQDTLARLQLRGRITGRTETELDGRLAHTTALREDFDVTGALASDTEDVINLTLAVAGVEVAVIFVEQASGGFKLSFRSRSAVDCCALAQQFGGGGHKAAAGAFMAGPYDAVKSAVLDAVRAAMR